MQGIYLRCPGCRKFISTWSYKKKAKTQIKECPKCASPIKHNDKIYYIRFKGKWRKIGNSYKNAENMLISLKKQDDLKCLSTILPKRKNNITFRNFLKEEYENYLRNESLKKGTSTYRYEKSRINILNTYFGKMPLNMITEDNIEEFLNYKRKDNVTEATIDRYITRLKAIFKHAIRKKIITQNPMTHIKTLNITEEVERVLTKNEITLLLKACKESRNSELYHIVSTALCTYLRKGNVLKLKVSCFDFDTMDLKISPKFMKNNKILKLPLSKNYVKKIQQYIKNNDLSEDDYLFKTKYFERAWKNALKKANIKNFRFHDLRHTAATTMIIIGVELEIIRQILGHNSATITTKYLHRVEPKYRAAIENLDDYYFAE